MSIVSSIHFLWRILLLACYQNEEHQRKPLGFHVLSLIFLFAMTRSEHLRKDGMQLGTGYLSPDLPGWGLSLWTALLHSPSLGKRGEDYPTHHHQTLFSCNPTRFFLIVTHGSCLPFVPSDDWLVTSLSISGKPGLSPRHY